MLAALHRAARARREFEDRDTAELETLIRVAFEMGLNEPHLEWYHRNRPA